MKISEKIAKLRKELKDLGYNNRKISVTNGGGNLESSIYVHFKFTPTEEEISKVRKIAIQDRKSTRLNSSHPVISYAVFCLKKKDCDA